MNFELIEKLAQFFGYSMKFVQLNVLSVSCIMEIYMYKKCFLLAKIAYYTTLTNWNKMYRGSLLASACTVWGAHSRLKE